MLRVAVSERTLLNLTTYYSIAAISQYCTHCSSTIIPLKLVVNISLFPDLCSVCLSVCLSLSLSLSLSLRFNGHFPDEPGLAGVYWSKGWWRWWWQLDYWSYKSYKAPVKSSPTNQHPVFLQARCSSCRPTNSVKALRGKYHIPWTCWPQAHLEIFQLCLWPLIAPGYLGEGCHASHQPSDARTTWCQYPTCVTMSNLVVLRQKVYA